MHMSRYLVYAGLDYRIMAQDGRNAFPLAWVVQRVRCCCSLWLTEMEYKKMRTHCKVEH